MQCLQTCYAQPNLLWPSRSMPVTSTSFCQTLHGPFVLPTIQYKKPHQVQQYLDKILFDIPFIADWKTIGEHGQRLTDRNTDRKNEGRIDYDYKVGQKILVRNKGILRKAQSIWHNDPWTIRTVHTNGTIMVQCGNKIRKIDY